MQAVYFDGQDLILKNVKEPYPAADEAKVQLEWGGICSTDLQILLCYGNFIGIIGHEAIGKVISAPALPELVGKRAAFNINISCRKSICNYCTKNNHKHCSNRRVLGIRDYPGAFSEFFIVPAINVIAIPDNLDPRKAVFAEPLAAAIEPLTRNLFDEEEEILVLGAGKLGVLTMLGLNAHGFKTTGIVRSIERKDFLRLAYPELKIKTQKELLGKYSVIFETTGNFNGLKTALYSLRPQGKMFVKSTISEISSKSKSGKIVVKQVFSAKELNYLVKNEISIFGSRCGNISKSVELLASGAVNPEPLISAQYPLNKAGQAFKRAKNYPSDKVLIYNNVEHPSIA